MLNYICINNMKMDGFFCVKKNYIIVKDYIKLFN